MFRYVYHHALVIWIGLISAASLYAGQNIGGSGLELPFNIFVWGVVCLFIMTSVIKVLHCQCIHTSRLVWYFAVVLLNIFLIGSFSDHAKTDALMRTAFNFSVLVLFFWALFQYSLTDIQFRQILVILCAVGFIQALISVVQIHDVYKVAYTLIPYEAFRYIGDRPLGNFQQVNMLATFLSFVLVSTLYLLLSRRFLTYSRVFKIGLFLGVLLSFYVLLLTGSRAGLLTFIIAVTCMLVARYQVIKRMQRWFLLWLLSLLLAFVLSVYFPGQATGLELVAEKMAGLSQAVRLSLYQYSLEMFMLTPLIGLGIGNFIEPFATYVKEQQNTELLELYITHPHNEWLFWMLQSGVIALLAPLVFAGWYVFQLFKSGFQTALAMLALLTPFLIQSQLSYPFSLSSMHLFLLLFMLYAGVRFVRKRHLFRLNSELQRLLLAGALVLMCVVPYATWHTLKSIKEMYIFENSLFYTQFQTKEEIANQRYLQHAAHNWLYRKSVIKVMNLMAEKAIKTNNKYDLNQFVWWANSVQNLSEQSLLSLAKVYLELEQAEQADTIAKRILEQYGVVLKISDLKRQIKVLKAAKWDESGA